MSLSLSIAPKILHIAESKTTTATTATTSSSTTSSSSSSAPARYDAKTFSPLSFSLSLCLSLFALSVLEAAPPSWLLVLDNQVIKPVTDDAADEEILDSSYLTVSRAYFVILGTLSFYILVIFPSIAGVYCLEGILDLPNCQPSSFYGGGCCCCCCCSCCKNQEFPWWMRIFTSLWSVLTKLALIFWSPVFGILQRISQLSHHSLSFVMRRGRLQPRGKMGLSRRDSNKGHSLPVTSLDINCDNNNGSCSPRHAPEGRLGCWMNRLYDLFILRGGTLCFGSLLGIMATYGLLRSLSPFVITPKSTGNSLALALSWICAVGIILSTLLNGFGSVSLPHSCLVGLFLKPISSDTIEKAMDNLRKTEESLERRKGQVKEIDLRRVTSLSTISTSNATTGRTLFWKSKRSVKKSFSGLGEQVKQQKLKMEQEIVFLQSLVEEMQEDIEDMKYTQAVEAASRTVCGRIYVWMGVFFSLILLARLYSAITTIMHRWNQSSIATMDGTPPRKRDLVTWFVLWLSGYHMVSEKDYAQVSQFISLFLTAMLSFSQVRAFLRTFGIIHRRLNHIICLSSSTSVQGTPTNADSSSSGGSLDEKLHAADPDAGVYVHAVAALMGSYFMACLILAKMMVPWQYRSSFSGALGGFDAFLIQSDLITTLFAFSAVVSTTIFALLFGIQRQNSMRHTISWTEDSGSPKNLDV